MVPKRLKSIKRWLDNALHITASVWICYINIYITEYYHRYIHTCDMITWLITGFPVCFYRYSSIMYPLRPRMSRSTLTCCVCTIWVVSLTVAIPTATTTVTTTMYERNDVGEIIGNFTTCWESHWTNHTMMSFYTILLFIVEFIIPLGLMMFVYFSIAKKLWFRNVPGGHMTQQQEMVVEKTKRRTIRMLIIVVTLFAVCWAPFHGYAINRDFIMPSFQGERTLHFFTTFYFVEALAMSNSVFNTIIYIVINANFRMAAMQMVLPKSLWKKDPSPNPYVRYHKYASRSRTGALKNNNYNGSLMTSSTCLGKDKSPKHQQIL